VTDLSSARFYAILDTGYVPPARWTAVCRALLVGGADIVQLRAKRETSARRRELLEEILPLFAPSAVVAAPPPLVVNDDIELALAYPGLGLHVGQDDLAPQHARARLGPGRILGLSTHSPVQAAAAQALPAGTLDYFAVGPVFATPTKPDYTPVGLELVHHVAATHPALPWFCIGGIKRANLPTVLAAGASRVVVVSEVLNAADPGALIRDLRAALGSH
jgi:thiamine-phosphate pyrophosphorylase